MTIEIVDIVHSVLFLYPMGLVFFNNALLEQHSKSLCPWAVKCVNVKVCSFPLLKYNWNRFRWWINLSVKFWPQVLYIHNFLLRSWLTYKQDKKKLYTFLVKSSLNWLISFKPIISKFQGLKAIQVYFLLKQCFIQWLCHHLRLCSVPWIWSTQLDREWM